MLSSTCPKFNSPKWKALLIQHLALHTALGWACRDVKSWFCGPVAHGQVGGQLHPRRAQHSVGSDVRRCFLPLAMGQILPFSLSFNVRSALWRDSARRAPGAAPRPPPPLSRPRPSEHPPFLSRASSPSFSKPVASLPPFRAL